MKIETTIIKGFDTVKFFRKVKEKISKEIYGMSDEQLKEYFKNNTKEKFFEKYNEQKSKKEIVKHI
jgi:predicted membrane-bound dolichyl-phosphate-mannose-protein mannosyltransferase